MNLKKLEVRKALAAALLLFATAAPMAAQPSGPVEQLQTSWNVEATGRMLCNGVPMAGVQVDLMHSVVSWSDAFDRVMDTTYTDSNGVYQLRGAGGSIFGPPAPYARAVYDSRVGDPAIQQVARVRVTNEIGSSRSDHGDTRAHPWQAGVINLGTDNFTTLDCALWQNSHRAVADYKGAIDGDAPLPYSDLAVMHWSAIYTGTPFSTLETIAWPTNFGVSFTNMLHEFGHTVRHTLDGDFNHFLSDVLGFNYLRYHSPVDNTNEGFAFNEGWAEFWAMRDRVPPRTQPFINTPPIWSVEGDVAAELRRLATCVGDAQMVRVLRANGGAIHSRDQFFAAYQRLFPGACVPPPPPPPSPPTDCASGIVSQQFFDGMVGCAGNVAQRDAATLCGANMKVCSADQWIRSRGTLKPLHNYWVSDKLDLASYLGRCTARPAGTGTACASASMHVCDPTGMDPEGNTCKEKERDCYYDPPIGTEFPSIEFFGGCDAGSGTAGALCCPVTAFAAAAAPAIDNGGLAARRRHRQLLLEAIEQLEKRLAAARREAVLPTVCPRAGCGKALEKLIQPALLAGELERRRLDLARLEAGPRSMDEVQLKVANGTFESWRREGAQSYVRDAAGIQRKALQWAIAALRPALGNRATVEAARAAIRELTTQMDEMGRLMLEPDHPSPSLQPFDPDKQQRLQGDQEGSR